MDVQWTHNHPCATWPPVPDSQTRVRYWREKIDGRVVENRSSEGYEIIMVKESPNEMIAGCFWGCFRKLPPVLKSFQTGL